MADGSSSPRVLPPGWRLVSPFLRGESRASFLVERDGQRAVLREHAGGGEPTAAEAQLLRRLRDSGLPVPAVIGAGTDWLLLEELPGEPCGDWVQAHCGEAEIGDTFHWLARLHRLQPGALEPLAVPRDRWAYVLEPGQRRWSELRANIAFSLRETQQTLGDAGERRALCHGDLHPANVLAMDGAVTGLLDWEMAQWSFAMYDLGYALLTFGSQWPEGRIEPARCRVALDAYAAHAKFPPRWLRTMLPIAALAIDDWCAALPVDHPRRGQYIAHWGRIVETRGWERIKL
jgi:Ser/Thr protein kinase RdoA (MazF antagonist)